LVEACLAESPAATRSISQSYPATVTTGLMAAAALTEALGQRPRFMVAAGYSLGYFTALVLAGALSPADAMRLVVVRAVAMRDAAARRPGVMALVPGVGAAALRDRASDRPAGLGEVVVGCVNAADSAVLSGDRDAVVWIAGSLIAEGHEVKPVATGLAAHSPLMRPAQDEFNAHLDPLRMRPPHAPVLLNSDGTACGDPVRLADELRTQLVTPVRWDLCQATLAGLGLDQLVDLGPGAMMAKFSAGAAPAICLNAAAPFDVEVSRLRRDSDGSRS
jgi:[acyl-carrier-protein] S-malonyltransferase